MASNIGKDKGKDESEPLLAKLSLSEEDTSTSAEGKGTQEFQSLISEMKATTSSSVADKGKEQYRSLPIEIKATTYQTRSSTSVVGKNIKEYQSMNVEMKITESEPGPSTSAEDKGIQEYQSSIGEIKATTSWLADKAKEQYQSLPIEIKATTDHPTTSTSTVDKYTKEYQSVTVSTKITESQPVPSTSVVDKDTKEYQSVTVSTKITESQTGPSTSFEDKGYETYSGEMKETTDQPSSTSIADPGTEQQLTNVEIKATDQPASSSIGETGDQDESELAIAENQLPVIIETWEITNIQFLHRFKEYIEYYEKLIETSKSTYAEMPSDVNLLQAIGTDHLPDETRNEFIPSIRTIHEKIQWMIQTLNVTIQDYEKYFNNYKQIVNLYPDTSTNHKIGHCLLRRLKMCVIKSVALVYCLKKKECQVSKVLKDLEEATE